MKNWARSLLFSAQYFSKSSNRSEIIMDIQVNGKDAKVW